MRCLSLTHYCLALATVFLTMGFFARGADASFIVQAPNSLSLTRGLVGYWSFDGKTVVGTRAYDMSGNGNYGTLTGSNGLPVPTVGKIG